jgi:quinoprotein glucose dehydrogenase
LWDYDLPSPPVLLTIRVNGRTIDVVAVPSKVGFLYVFDRVTGEPVWPIEERPVPASDVPGEQASPTQPFPTKPAPFARQGFTESDLVDFTPAIRAQALEMFHKLRSGPLFTPPSFEGTLTLPGIIGGANWGSAAADPARGIVYVKASNSAAVLRIVPGDPADVEGDYTADLGAMGASLPNGIPLVKPPYGTLTAIDVNTGQHKWQVTVGDAPNVRQNPALRGVQLPSRLGASGAAGPLLTAGGLVFLTGGGSTLYAFDADTGAEVWSADLGGRGYSNPMTYEAGGRQYIVIASGSGEEARLTAFTLRD